MKRVSIVLGLSLVACGSDSPTGSGVNGALVLEQLTDAQKTAVCQAEVRYWYATDTSVERRCTLEAVSETTSISECNAFVDTCVREDNATMAAKQKQELEDCTQVDRESLHCKYTVAEYERCYKEARSGAERAALEASCRYPEGGSDDGGEGDYVSDDCRPVLDRCYTE